MGSWSFFLEMEGEILPGNAAQHFTTRLSPVPGGLDAPEDVMKQGKFRKPSETQRFFRCSCSQLRVGMVLEEKGIKIGRFWAGLSPGLAFLAWQGFLLLPLAYLCPE
jgi:hypothetical protein